MYMYAVSFSTSAAGATHVLRNRAAVPSPKGEGSGWYLQDLNEIYPAVDGSHPDIACEAS